MFFPTHQITSIRPAAGTISASTPYPAPTWVQIDFPRAIDVRAAAAIGQRLTPTLIVSKGSDFRLNDILTIVGVLNGGTLPQVTDYMIGNPTRNDGLLAYDEIELIGTVGRGAPPN